MTSVGFLRARVSGEFDRRRLSRLLLPYDWPREVPEEERAAEEASLRALVWAAARRLDADADLVAIVIDAGEIVDEVRTAETGGESEYASAEDEAGEVQQSNAGR